MCIIFFYTALRSLYPNAVLFTLFYIVVATRFPSYWRKNRVLPMCTVFLIGGGTRFSQCAYTRFDKFHVVVTTCCSFHWGKNQVLPMCVSISMPYEIPYEAVSIRIQLCLRCFMWPSPYVFHLIGGRIRFPQILPCW